MSLCMHCRPFACVAVEGFEFYSFLVKSSYNYIFPTSLKKNNIIHTCTFEMPIRVDDRDLKQ